MIANISCDKSRKHAQPSQPSREILTFISLVSQNRKGGETRSHPPHTRDNHAAGKRQSRSATRALAGTPAQKHHARRRMRGRELGRRRPTLSQRSDRCPGQPFQLPVTLDAEPWMPRPALRIKQTSSVRAPPTPRALSRELFRAVMISVTIGGEPWTGLT